MLWVVLQTGYELCDWMALVADLIHCIEQWEPGGRGGIVECIKINTGLTSFLSSAMIVCAVLLLNLLVN